MSGRTINKLLQKYYRKEGGNQTAHFKIHPGERNTKEYHQKIRQEANRKNRYLILQQLINEAPFHITKTQQDQIMYWIDTFNGNFKNFHRRSSEETIILGFIMIQYKQVNPKMSIKKYKICKKYKLTHPIFEMIQNQLIFELMKTTPMTYTQAKYYHQYLEENNEK